MMTQNPRHASFPAIHPRAETVSQAHSKNARPQFPPLVLHDRTKISRVGFLLANVLLLSELDERKARRRGAGKAGGRERFAEAPLWNFAR
jgi:hypothetical protein